MADQLLPSRIILRDTDADASPLAGGTVTFVTTGTTTPATVYSDAACTIPAANPLTADASGRVGQTWFPGGSVLDAIVKRANGTTVETISRVVRFGESSSAASGTSFLPASGIAATNVQDAIEELADDIAAQSLTTAQRYATYGGTANAITLSSGASLSALVVGMAFRFRATATNTGATTINVDGLGAQSCVTLGGVALPANYIRTDVETVAWWTGAAWVVDRIRAPGLSDTPYCTVGGTANALTLTSGLALASVATGQQVRFRASGTNTGAATIALDGLAATACRTVTGVALPAGYIRTGIDTTATFDGTYWVVERASESSGTSSKGFLRHANGILECWGTVTTSTTANVTDTFAAPFIATPRVVAGVVTGTTGGQYATTYTATATQAEFATYNSGGTQTSRGADYHAKGFWY